MLLRVGHEGIQVAHDAGVGDGVHHPLERRLIRQVEDTALSCVRLERDAQKSLPGEAARHVFDVLVHPPDLRDDQDHRVPSCRAGPGLVDGDLEIPSGDFGVCSDQAVGWGGDDLAGHGGGGDGETGQADPGSPDAGDEFPPGHFLSRIRDPILQRSPPSCLQGRRRANRDQNSTVSPGAGAFSVICGLKVFWNASTVPVSTGNVP